MKRRVPLIFRNIVLRLLLMSTLSGLLTTVLFISFFPLNPQLPQPEISFWATSIVPLILVILHHTLRLWPRKYWLVICEVLFSLVEVVATGYFLAPFLPEYIQMISEGYYLYIFPLQMAFAGSLFVTTIFSFISFVFLFCDMLSGHWRSFLHPYDFSAGLCPPGRQWSFIWGRFVTRKRFSTDNRFIRCIRAGFAFFCLFAMLALVTYTLILQPFGLEGRQGVKLSKVLTINGNTAFALETALGMKEHGNFPPFQAVLTVSDNPVSYPAMNLTQSLVYSGNYTQFPSGCQGSTISSGTVLGNCNSVLTPFNPAIVGEILITIKFADASSSFASNQLYLGMADSTDDILAGATPIDIVPGANLRGLSSISVQQRISNRQAATFGIPQYRRFAVVNVDSLNPDLSPSLSKDNHTATLRIQTRHQPYIEIEQEYIEGSVLNGLALVGGVWTLINGLFAAIFGTTLLLVLFGIKPLSIYGLVHLFRPGRGSLADGGYTLSSKERDRIVEMLREHLLDVESAEGDGSSSCQDSSVSVLPQYTCSHCGGGGASMIK